MKHLLQQVGRALVVYAGAAYVGDRLVRPHWAAIAAESERVLAEDGEVMVTSSHPAMLHSWLGRKWVLFDLDDGRKHAKPLWGARRAAPLEGPQEGEEPATDPETQADGPEDI